MFVEERLISEKITISENNYITKDFLSTIREHIALIIKNVVSQNESFIDMTCKMVMRYKGDDGNNATNQVALDAGNNLEEWYRFMSDMALCDKMDLFMEYKYYDDGYYDNNGPYELMRKYCDAGTKETPLNEFITMEIAESSGHEHLKKYYFGIINDKKHFGEVNYVKTDIIPEGPWYCNDIVADLVGLDIEDYIGGIIDSKSKEYDDLVSEFLEAEGKIHKYCYSGGEVVGDVDDSGFYYSGVLLNSPAEESIKTGDLDDFAKNLAVINKYFENHNPQTLYFGNVESRNMKQMAIKFYVDGHYDILLTEI